MESLHLKYNPRSEEKRVSSNKNIAKIEYALHELNKGSDFLEKTYHKNFGSGIRNFKAEMAVNFSSNEKK